MTRLEVLNVPCGGGGGYQRDVYHEHKFRQEKLTLTNEQTDYLPK